MTENKTATRTETDTMGAIEVPADRYWGAQTQRSLAALHDRRRPHARSRSSGRFGILKKAAALVNRIWGSLPAGQGAT